MPFFEEEDLNGDYYSVGETGEVLDMQAHRVIFVRNGIPASTQNDPGKISTLKLEGPHAVTFIEDNFFAQLNCGLSPENAAKVAFIRLIALRAGLVSPEFAVDKFKVKYNECIRNSVAISDEAGKLKRGVDLGDDELIPEIAAVLTKEVRNKLRKDFSNAVCCIAYMFRVRGHHWIADMDEKYKALWRKCLKSEDTPGVNWELYAHNSVHAIMPLTLDLFWNVRRAKSEIAGALAKRYDSAPAGCAGVRALEAGMNDLAATLPQYKVLNEDQYEELERLLEKMKEDRWAGSVNRGFYGGTDLGFTEGQFAGIASTIVAALDQFAPSSPLRNSVALKRMAQGAPISGGFTARMIATAAADASNAKALIYREAPDGEE